MKRQDLTEFFNTDYVDAASYANLRQIPSFIDGAKNASRKIIYWTFTNNIKYDIKVSQYDSKVGEAMQSLHGSMAEVIVGLGKNYTGSNNLEWLTPDGNFGTRLINEASAPRYISAQGSEYMFNLLNKNDLSILEHQTFEGTKIEPKFLLPSLPMLLVNGSSGISSGFANKILPRNPKEIEKYLKYNLTGRNKTNKPFKNKPFYKGFKGDIVQGDIPSQWIIQGIVKMTGLVANITELPIGYSLKSYIKVLDKLEDEKKIKGYTDLSNKDFHFKVQFTREMLQKVKDPLDYLKLQKKITENYTVMNHENRVQVFESPDDIFQEYIKIKKIYLKKRKEHMVRSLSMDIRVLVSRYIFIKAVNDKTLVIANREIKDITTELGKIQKIIKVDDTYDYLIDMKIRSMTKERLLRLMQEIKDKKSTLDLVKSQTVEEMWLGDLDG